MRVAILTMGSRGDVYPYVALGDGLARAGHRVTIVTLEPFREVVERHSLAFHPLADPLGGLKHSTGWVRWQSSDASLWSKLRGLRATFEAARESLGLNFDACRESCRHADVIVSGIAAVAAPHIAEQLGAFHAWALLQPFTPTGAFPHCLAPFRATGSRRVNSATYRVADAVFAWCFDGPLTEWRTAAMMARSRGRAKHPGGDGHPVLYGFSPQVVAPAPDWPGHVHVTGYWPLDDVGWTPPDLLSTFIDEGAPPIAVFHSAITGWSNPDAALTTLRDAIDLAGCRAVILSDRVADAPRLLSESCLAVNWTSVPWLFARVALVVHHGGAGTTAATLRAGRPSVVLPSCFDQPFWAHLLGRLGTAPPPLRPSRLTAPALAARIREARDTPVYLAAAGLCAARLASEDGVGEAVRILERYARTTSATPPIP